MHADAIDLSGRSVASNTVAADEGWFAFRNDKAHSKPRHQSWLRTRRLQIKFDGARSVGLAQVAESPRNQGDSDWLHRLYKLRLVERSV
jgi:hypothetical protein